MTIQNLAFRHFRCLIPAVFFCQVSTSISQDPARMIEVPGGGQLSYYFQKDASGDVAALVYSGSPEWFVSQEDERSHWHTLPSLSQITLTHTTATPEEIKRIASLTGVERFQIDETVLIGEALTPLEGMTWLKELHLLHIKIKREGYQNTHWSFLDKLASLDSLLIWWGSVDGEIGEIDEQTFMRICKLKQLKELSVNLGAISDESVALIANLPLLESVSLGDVKNATPLVKALSRNRNLRELSFSARELGEIDVGLISEMSGLEGLFLSGQTIQSVSQLKNLEQLKNVRLVFKTIRESDGLAFLKKMPDLKSLTLHCPIASDASIESLRGHRELEWLETPSVVLHDKEIEVLETMPNLKYVKVGNKINSPWHRLAQRRLPNAVIEGAEE